MMRAFSRSSTCFCHALQPSRLFRPASLSAGTCKLFAPRIADWDRVVLDKNWTSRMDTEIGWHRRFFTITDENIEDVTFESIFVHHTIWLFIALQRHERMRMPDSCPTPDWVPSASITLGLSSEEREGWRAVFDCHDGGNEFCQQFFEMVFPRLPRGMEKESFATNRTFPGLGKIHTRPVLYATEPNMVGCTAHLALTASAQDIS